MSGPFTDAQLAAFLDGRLEDEALLAAIEEAVNADPALAARIEALAADEAPAQAVRDAFAPVLGAPVPGHLVRIVQPAQAEVIDLAARRKPAAPANDTRPASGWRWPQFAGMAACLAVGVLIGGPLLRGGGGTGGGEPSLVLASADVSAMLDTAPSGQRYDLASLGTGEVVLTFRNTDGALCRQFMIAGKGGTTSDALACAANGAWQVEAYGRRAAPVGEMKLAAGDAAPGVVAAVDAMIDSDPLLGADEAQALGRK